MEDQGDQPSPHPSHTPTFTPQLPSSHQLHSNSGGINVDVELGKAQESFQKVLRHLAEERERLRRYVDEEMANVKNERTKVNEELAQQRAALVREREQLCLMRSVAEKLEADQNQKVRIEVGGQEFTSTLRTITTEKDSLFEALFSGNFAVERTATGAVHIDRDPRLFAYVLNFLRALRACRETSHQDLTRFPEAVDESTKEQLIIDAQYYGLDCMLRCLRCSTIVVSAKSRHRKISEALQDARDGDTILVTPGKYIDSFTIMHSVNIVGDGDRADIIIQSPGTHCVECRSLGGSIRNLTIESSPIPGAPGGTYGEFYCVLVSEGSIIIEGNDLRNTGLSCAKIIGEEEPIGPGKKPTITNPTLRNNSIHNASQCGILLTNGAQGVLEGNEIFDNRFSGIELRHGAAPLVKNNNIHDNKQNGIYIHSSGLGTLIGNTISRNQFNGINVEGTIVIKDNIVTQNAKRGIYHAHDTILENNEVSGNILGDVTLK